MRQVRRRAFEAREELEHAPADQLGLGFPPEGLGPAVCRDETPASIDRVKSLVHPVEDLPSICGERFLVHFSPERGSLTGTPRTSRAAEVALGQTPAPSCLG